MTDIYAQFNLFRKAVPINAFQQLCADAYSLSADSEEPLAQPRSLWRPGIRGKPGSGNCGANSHDFRRGYDRFPASSDNCGTDSDHFGRISHDRELNSHYCEPSSDNFRTNSDRCGGSADDFRTSSDDCGGRSDRCPATSDHCGRCSGYYERRDARICSRTKKISDNSNECE